MQRLKNKQLASCALLWAIMTSSPAIGKIETIITTDKYNVFAKYPKDLKTELGKYSGSQWHGTTAWGIKWSYKLKETNGLCEVENQRITLKIKYKMPQLYPVYKDKNVKIIFDNYYKRLMNHEKGHARNGEIAAKEIELMLSQLDEISCKNAAKTINQLASNTVQKYRKLDKEYDRITQHGLKQ
jgi:predicted secreted Zn-dependent protease